jgi:outer membrane protein assembly factor BamE (lipoprotein component of BamABCDE complex)
MKFVRIALIALLLGGCASLEGSRALSDRDTAQVRQGMTRADAERLLGKPVETMRFARTSTEAWDYQLQDTWGYLIVFSVIFGPEGTVVGTVSRRVNDGGGFGT